MIYFFEKGKIIACGTLEEVKNNSQFRNLWKKYILTKDKK
jgi:ABC-type multidrug transport system ATPase subunit